MQVEEELNMVTLIKTVHKLKAAVCVLIGSNLEKVQEINNFYLRDTIVSLVADDGLRRR